MSASSPSPVRDVPSVMNSTHLLRRERQSSVCRHGRGRGWRRRAGVKLWTLPRRDRLFLHQTFTVIPDPITDVNKLDGYPLWRWVELISDGLTAMAGISNLRKGRKGGREREDRASWRITPGYIGNFRHLFFALHVFKMIYSESSDDDECVATSGMKENVTAYVRKFMSIFFPKWVAT